MRIRILGLVFPALPLHELGVQFSPFPALRFEAFDPFNLAATPDGIDRGNDFGVRQPERQRRYAQHSRLNRGRFRSQIDHQCTSSDAAGNSGYNCPRNACRNLHGTYCGHYSSLALPESVAADPNPPLRPHRHSSRGMNRNSQK